jgi:hypothetical protein
MVWIKVKAKARELIGSDPDAAQRALKPQSSELDTTRELHFTLTV